jgi:hypothetical protein
MASRNEQGPPVVHEAMASVESAVVFTVRVAALAVVAAAVAKGTMANINIVR